MDEYGYYRAGKRGLWFLYECAKCMLVFMSFKDWLPGEYVCMDCRKLKNYARDKKAKTAC